MEKISMLIKKFIVSGDIAIDKSGNLMLFIILNMVSYYYNT